MVDAALAPGSVVNGTISLVSRVPWEASSPAEDRIVLYDTTFDRVGVGAEPYFDASTPGDVIIWALSASDRASFNVLHSRFERHIGYPLRLIDTFDFQGSTRLFLDSNKVPWLASVGNIRTAPGTTLPFFRFQLVDSEGNPVAHGPFADGLDVDRGFTRIDALTNPGTTDTDRVRQPLSNQVGDPPAGILTFGEAVRRVFKIEVYERVITTERTFTQGDYTAVYPAEDRITGIIRGANSITPAPSTSALPRTARLQISGITYRIARVRIQNAVDWVVELTTILD